MDMLTFDDYGNNIDEEETDSVCTGVVYNRVNVRRLFSAKKRREQDTMTRLSSILDDEVTKIDDRTTNLTGHDEEAQ